MTESDWWALVDADPAAFEWSVFADWLEERADGRAEAAREARRKHRTPCLCPRASELGHTFDWYTRFGRWHTQASELPDDVFERLPGGECRYPGCKEYTSASEACRALLVALAGRG